jgi:multidrug resistance efflux pump
MKILKRINILYIAAIIAIVVLWKMNAQYNEEVLLFYGFAETKETEINLEHPVQVNQILVTTGQRVTKNTPLLEVAHNKIPLKLDEIVYEQEETEIKQLTWKMDILATIDKLETKKAIKASEINAEIAQIEAKLAENRSLVKDLNSFEKKENQQLATVTEMKIAALKEELKMALQPLDAEIKRLNQSLKTNNPYNAKLQKLQTEQNFYEEQGRKLNIFAPSDGLIGNIHCKEAENITAFKTLITFYEENPTLVNGYVNENLVIHVNVGDTLTVSSSLILEYEIKGIVVGLGSRIIDIPERLRKYPEIKTYGREVLIKIPSDNKFLQKEKVLLKLDKPIKTNDGFFDLLFGTD